MLGYAGRMLLVDLNSGKTKIEEIPEAFCRKFLGGNGFSIKLLYDYAKPKIDPLSPDNVLVFAVGPFCGTMIPASGKYIVQAKSPLTGFQGKAVSSGFWGQAFKRAGYDALVILGRAKKIMKFDRNRTLRFQPNSLKLKVFLRSLLNFKDTKFIVSMLLYKKFLCVRS